MAARYVRLFAFTLSVVAISSEDKYSESLTLTPLENGLIYSYFKLNTVWPLNVDDTEARHHYRLFPRKLGEVLHEYSVQELHLTLTQGLWKYQRWGFPREDAAPGAELWVWFREDTENVASKWRGLVNALSGMLCASLNFIDERVSVQPRYSFRPEGVAAENQVKNGRFVRYAALPSERMCTENLTPWKKLLPCGTKVGLTTLMRAQSLSDSHYHSVGIHVRPVCEGRGCHPAAQASADAVWALELKQTLSAVLEPVLSPSRRSHDWSLHSLFGRALGPVCAVAETSRIYVDLNMNSNADGSADRFTLLPEPESFLEIVGRRHAQYDVTDGFSLSLKYKQAVTYVQTGMSPLVAHRIVTGYGQESGGILCRLHNSLPTPIVVVYMEVIPWFLRLYYHTLKIESRGKVITADATHYVPGRDRERPHHLEVVFKIPANSSASLSIEFDRLLLKWTEYPPDANHGFYIPSAVVSALLPTCAVSGASCDQLTRSSPADETGFVRLRTESLLLSLPTPDFSMPYNVICLTCTVIAIAFGSLHNLTTKQFVAQARGTKGLLQRLKDHVKKLFGRQSTESGKGTAALNDSVATIVSEEVTSSDKYSPNPVPHDDKNSLQEAGDS